MCLSYFSSGENDIILKLENYLDSIKFRIFLRECEQNDDFYFCSKIGLYVNDRSFPLAEEITNRWIFFCLSLDLLNQTVSLAISNKVVFFQNLNISKTKADVRKLNIWWQNEAYDLSIPEKFTMLNIHSNYKNLDKFMCGEPGDLYAWNLKEWESRVEGHNSTLRTSMESTFQICQKEFQVYTLPELNYFDALKTCSQMHGNQYYENKAFQEMRSLKANQNKFWVPYTDTREEGVWRNVYNDSNIIDFTEHFVPGQPNGGKLDNFLLWDDVGLWDINRLIKSRFYYSLCKITKSKPYLVLRGLCPESLVERFYTAGNIDGKFVWKGSMSTNIHYTDRWLLHNKKNNVWAESKVKYESLVIGTSSWILHNDNCGNELDRANLSLRLYTYYFS